jgi:glycosyltransferase involved in cell wall biosynthesis
MRLALLTDAWSPQVNGVVTTWTQVVRRLRERGHDVLVVHPAMFRTVPLPRYPDIRLAVLPSRRLSLLLNEFTPDAVHIPTEGPIGLAGRSFCRRRGIPFTTSFHTHFAKYGKQYFHVPASVSYRAMRWFHGGAHCTLVPTASVKRELEEQRFDASRLIVWTRGVDTDLFRPRPGDIATTSLYSDLPRPVLVCCGRVAREKNIEAFLDLAVAGSKVVIGDGPARAALQRKYPATRFVGMRHGEDLASHIAAGDVFVFPSRTDTFGVVMLEAMACGLPVAAYPVTGPIDVVRHGVSGMLDDDLGAAVSGALALDRAAARAHAMEFSWDRCVNVLLDHLAILQSRDTSSGSEGHRRAMSGV